MNSKFVSNSSSIYRSSNFNISYQTNLLSLNRLIFLSISLFFFLFSLIYAYVTVDLSRILRSNFPFDALLFYSIRIYVIWLGFIEKICMILVLNILDFPRHEIIPFARLHRNIYPAR